MPWPTSLNAPTFGLPREFACQDCGRDFRVPANHRRRPCCQSSRAHHQYLLASTAANAARRRSGGLDRLEDINATIGIDYSLIIEEFEASLRSLGEAFCPSRTTLLLRAAHEIVCSRLGASRTIWRYDPNGVPIDQVRVEPMTPRTRLDIMRRTRQIYFDGIFTEEEELEVYRQVEAGATRFGITPMPPPRRPKPTVKLSTGVRMEATMREIVHPEGRCRRADGTRFDILCLETRFDPGLETPGEFSLGTGAFGNFIGERRSTFCDKLHLGAPFGRGTNCTMIAMPAKTRDFVEAGF